MRTPRALTWFSNVPARPHGMASRVSHLKDCIIHLCAAFRFFDHKLPRHGIAGKLSQDGGRSGAAPDAQGGPRRTATRSPYPWARGTTQCDWYREFRW
jgi:hypothetical protein